MLALVCMLLYGAQLSLVECARFSEGLSEIAVLAKEGKQHLESINEKANVPQYGPCWTSAVLELQTGCKHLSEITQSQLALRFTDCFLQMSGQEPLDCVHADACLSRLSDRGYIAYTQFYTHTQSICYFLQSQLWHEEAEITIDKLSTTSAHVSKQLAEAEETQAALLIQQKQSIELQKNLLSSLAATLEHSQARISALMSEFQSYTTEQKEALYDVFDQLSSFKAWAVGEVSWFDSIFFYTCSVLLAYLLTSASRTQQARIYIFILLTLNYFTEQYITSFKVDKLQSEVHMIKSTEYLNLYIWYCRRTFVLLCVLVTLIAAFRYVDYNTANYHLLMHIKNQNVKIMALIDKLSKSNESLREVQEAKPIHSINAFDHHTPTMHSDVIALPYSSLTYERNSGLPSSIKPVVKPEVPSPALFHTYASSRRKKREGSVDGDLLSESSVETNSVLGGSVRGTTPLRRSNRTTHRVAYNV